MSLLVLSAVEAAAFAEARPGWWFVPCRIEADGRGGFLKRPLVPWTSSAASGGDAVQRLWDSVGGRAGIAAVTGPSGLVVLDEDHSDYPPELKAFLDLQGTLTLTSCTKSRPHWFFRQEFDEAGRRLVDEGRWPGGDVKATGLVFFSAEEPVVLAGLVNVSCLLEPDSPFVGVLSSGGSGVGAAGACSREDLISWLESVPGDGLLVESESAQEKFIERVVAGFTEKVALGAHRRSAALDAVYQAAIEASAGLYCAERAYDALEDAYGALRARDGSWDPVRQRDWNLMWQTLVPKLLSGALDDAVDECRTGALERGAVTEPDDPGLEYLIWLVEQWNCEDTGVGDSGAGAGAGAGARSLKARLAQIAAEPVPAPEPEPESESEPESERAWDVAEVLEVAASVAVAREGPAPVREPVLGVEALYGPHGVLIEALRGKHEVADVGLLAGLLAEAGILLSGQAHWAVDDVDIHGPNLFVNMIGPSGMGRKSHAMNIARMIFEPVGVSAVPGLWGVRREKCKGSGEYLIHRVWKDPEPGVPGVSEEPRLGLDKRVLFRMPEVSVLWKKARSDGSTMAETFCEIWDQNDLEAGSLTSGEGRVARDAYAAGCYGSSTVDVTRQVMSGSLDAVSGFGNRFLWFWLPDSGLDLPDGYPLTEVPEVAEYRRQWEWVADGKVAGWPHGRPVDWAPAARVVWHDVYGDLKRSKGASAVVRGLNGRAEAYVKRLALGYALSVDGLEVFEAGVSVDALLAALAVWKYCRESVEFLFGAVGVARRVLTDREVLLGALEEGGCPVSELKERCRWPGGKLAVILREAHLDGAVECWNVSRGGTGRPGRPAKWVFRPGEGAVELPPHAVKLDPQS